MLAWTAALALVAAGAPPAADWWYVIMSSDDGELNAHYADAASIRRDAMSAPGCSKNRPNIAKVMPQVLISTRAVAETCGQPGFTTMSGRNVKLQVWVRPGDEEPCRLSEWIDLEKRLPDLGEGLPLFGRQKRVGVVEPSIA